jgi:arsenate reductase (thioredoxin)
MRVLFVCIGNSCRSQMAEGFALSYGKDVMAVESAGLAPATLVAPLTRKVMLEAKHIDLSEHWPKPVFDTTGPFDMIVNISGHPLPPEISAGQVRVWTVEDPVLGDEAVQLKVANEIEGLVQQLILELRHVKH